MGEPSSNLWVADSDGQAGTGVRYHVPTGAPEFDSMLGGGVAGGSVVELIGGSRCGKTQLCHLLSVTAQGAQEDARDTRRRVVYIDTQGTFRPERVQQIAERRRMQVDDVMDSITYAQCHSSAHLVRLVDSVGSMLGDDGEVALVVVDSIAGVVCKDYSNACEHADSVRNLAQAMGELRWMSHQFNIAVVLVNQVDHSQEAAFDPVEHSPLPGEHLAGRFSAVQVYLRRGHAEQRVARVASPGGSAWRSCAFTIFSGGIRDSSD